MADEQKLYFYKCAGEEYSTGHVYFDHANGIAGYKTVQQRARYLGHYTANELEEELKTTNGGVINARINGRRSGYTNTSRQYNARF